MSLALKIAILIVIIVLMCFVYYIEIEFRYSKQRIKRKLIIYYNRENDRKSQENDPVDITHYKINDNNIEAWYSILKRYGNEFKEKAKDYRKIPLSEIDI